MSVNLSKGVRLAKDHAPDPVAIGLDAIILDATLSTKGMDSDTVHVTMIGIRSNNPAAMMLALGYLTK